MKSITLRPMLLLLACTAVSHAAERHADAAGTVLLAAVADATVPPVHMGATTEVHAESAGVAESLPDLPQGPALLPAMFHIPQAQQPVAQEEFTTALPDGPGVSLLQSTPLAGVARKLRARNFNTDDGSPVDAFAICYRLNRRSSIQVIPGDPAPVKMAVTTMANNMGVTVGMVVRIARQR